MPILCYTTSISPIKTVQEIQAILAAHGATSVNMEIQDNRPVAMSFSTSVRDETVYFRLPSNPAGVLAAMKNDDKIPYSRCTLEQAERVTWRIIKNWIEAQMAIVEAGQAELAEVFLPYVIDQTDATLYRRIVAKGQIATTDRLLTGRAEL